MQWQTVAQGKAKDKWERKGCETGNSGSHSYSGSSSSGSGSYQTGPKGGCFTYSASGAKKYVAHSYCGVNKPKEPFVLRPLVKPWYPWLTA